MEGLQNSWPPFLTKTYDMVDDSGTDQIVSWSKMNNSFIVWDPHSLAMDLLPKHFKHSNFSSFVRQLNTYLWKKILERTREPNLDLKGYLLNAYVHPIFKEVEDYEDVSVFNEEDYEIMPIPAKRMSRKNYADCEQTDGLINIFSLFF